MTITHTKYGVGIVVRVDKKKKQVEADFGVNGVHVVTIALAVPNGKAWTDDEDMQKVIDKMLGVKRAHTTLVGGGAQTIPMSLQEIFEVCGYIANRDNGVRISAIVPQDGIRDREFERRYPSQPYFAVREESKFSTQYQIYIGDTENCPKVLKPYIGAGNLISRTGFAEDLVDLYGARFGSEQDADVMRAVAAEKSMLEAFDRGFAF